ILMAFALWAALLHTRLLFFAGLIVAPILAPSLKLFPPYDRKQDKPWLNAGGIQNSLKILDNYQIDYALLEPAQPLSYLLQHSPAWKPIYSDKVAVLFERTPGIEALEMVSKN